MGIASFAFFCENRGRRIDCLGAFALREVSHGPGNDLSYLSLRLAARGGDPHRGQWRQDCVRDPQTFASSSHSPCESAPFGICLAHQDILFCGHRHRSSDEAGYAGHQDVAASAAATPTPTTKLAVETIPSFTPRTAARNHPIRCVLCPADPVVPRHRSWDVRRWGGASVMRGQSLGGHRSRCRQRS